MARKRSRRGTKQQHGPSPAQVLKVFKESKKPLSRAELLKALDLPKKEREQLHHVLDPLVAEGKVIKLRGGSYGLSDSLKVVTGRLEIQRSGVGFVIPEDPRKKTDIFISPGRFGEAWHGDRVAVALLPGKGGGRARRPEGRVVRVIERKLKEFAVRLEKALGRDMFLAWPTDPKQRMRFMLDLDGFEDADKAEVGDVFQVRAGERLENELWAAEPISRLGEEDGVGVQEALVKLNHQVPQSFPEAALEEAAALPRHPDEADFTGRMDLRAEPFVTIDGVTAKDFDDAILVKPEGEGFRLWVAIADVSHYVSQGSAMDREAIDRGNSYYFPQSVEPMFPEALSNGLCSLNPSVPRLAVVAEVPFTKDGRPGEGRFYEAVIRSHARLTYAQVNRALFETDPAIKDREREVIANEWGDVLPHVEQAERLARVLNAVRAKRGSLDFDLPEPDIHFNLQGEAVDIRPKVRHFGHQLIEECMLAANEAVARFLTHRGEPMLYRVHENPDEDKLRNLFKILKHTDLGPRLPQKPSPKALQELLDAAENTDMDYLVGRLVLRSMMQAKYQPENLGHFGLASDCYGHFTSPIRRYADLQVHRALKRALQKNPEGPPPKPAALRKLGEHLSTTERTAVSAEREIVKRVTILVLRDRIGETFTGVVNSVMEFGFWVELTEVMAEGMVRVSTMDDDYYGFIPERVELVGERTGKRFRLGQHVTVRLTDVSLARLEVNLELLQEPRED